MAIPTGYTQSIRDGLVEKGVSPGSIGYNKNTNYVTVDGKDAIKSNKNYMGTNYSTQYNFNNDWNAYQNALKQPTPAVQTGTPAATTGAATTGTATPAASTQQYSAYATGNPYDSKYNALIDMLMNQVNNPTPVDANAIYGSPQWAAYQTQATKGAQQGIRAAQESMGSSGFGRSTALQERSQGIQNDATTYMNTQVLPQLMAQEQAARQQQLGNQFSVLDSLMGQQGIYDNRFNSANNLAVQEGQLTGNYLSNEAKTLIDQIMQAKQGYAGAQTREERDGFNASANNLRARLSAMGVENVDALFGSGTKLSQAQGNVNKAGVKTLAAQELASSNARDQRNYDRDVLESDRAFEYTQGRDKVADERWQTEFDRILKQDGVQEALAWAANSISQQNANTSAFSAQDSSDRGWSTLDYEMSKPAESKYQGMTASQVLSGIKDNYSEPIYDSKGEKTGTKVTTEPAKRKQMFLDVIDSALPSDTETNQVLTQLGFTKQEIEAYKKEFSGN